MTGTGFWWILLACAVYGALHSLLAARTILARPSSFPEVVALLLTVLLFGLVLKLAFDALGFECAGGISRTALIAAVDDHPRAGDAKHACDRQADCATGLSCPSFFFVSNADTRDVCARSCSGCAISPGSRRRPLRRCCT